MVNNTFLDGLVEYPVKALREIGTDPTVVQLLTDNPNIDMQNEEADAVFDKFLYDYGYVDNTTTESAAYICVEAEASKAPTDTMLDMKLYVTVFCHKQFMKLDAAKFKGMIGSRCDNLVRYTDRLLNGADIYGIGKLTLLSVRTVPAPTGFSAREMTYSIPTFKKRSAE